MSVGGGHQLRRKLRGDRQIPVRGQEGIVCRLCIPLSSLPQPKTSWRWYRTGCVLTTLRRIRPCAVVCLPFPALSYGRAGTRPCLSFPVSSTHMVVPLG